MLKRSINEIIPLSQLVFVIGIIFKIFSLLYYLFNQFKI